MVNEAILVFELEAPIPFTCSDSTAINKGTIMAMTDPMTVTRSSTTDEIVGGITANEKIASDGITKVGIYRRGYFKVKASGSITVGDTLGTGGTGAVDNYVYSNRTTLNLSGSKSLGIALETAADEETFLMELKPSIMYHP